MVKKITAYQADDGTTFTTKAEAEAHDLKLKNLRVIDQFVDQFVNDYAVTSAVARDLKAHIEKNFELLVPLYEDLLKRARKDKSKTAASVPVSAQHTTSSSLQLGDSVAQ